MRRLAMIVITAAALAACSNTQEPVRSPGDSVYKTRKVAVEPVEAVTVSGPFKVSILGGSTTPEVTVFGPPEMMADTLVEVVDATLSIQFKDGADWSWNPGAGMHAVVRLPVVSSIVVEGPSQVDATMIRTALFEAGIGGAGKLNIRRLEAESVELGIGGSGSITVEGTATNAQMGIGGSGSIEAKRLRVETAKIGIGGSGSVYADVSKSAEIGIGGYGRVEVVGGAQCTFAESQARQIDCR